jgi:hypothetical protein
MGLLSFDTIHQFLQPQLTRRKTAPAVFLHTRSWKLKSERNCSPAQANTKASARPDFRFGSKAEMLITSQ